MSKQYEVTVWEKIFHTVYVYADDETQAENLAVHKVQNGQDGDYSTDSAGIYDAEVEEVLYGA